MIFPAQVGSTPASKPSRFKPPPGTAIATDFKVVQEEDARRRISHQKGFFCSNSTAASRRIGNEAAPATRCWLEPFLRTRNLTTRRPVQQYLISMFRVRSIVLRVLLLILFILAVGEVLSAKGTFYVFPQLADGRLADQTSYRSTLMILPWFEGDAPQCTLALYGMS